PLRAINYEGAVAPVDADTILAQPQEHWTLWLRGDQSARTNRSRFDYRKDGGIRFAWERQGADTSAHLQQVWSA
ncbi:MAG: hypothetical protein ACK4RK_22055, partial [Gemmataceae bacterium]